MAAPQSSQFPAGTVFDYLLEFSGGMDSGTSPLLLPNNQLAWASNATNRGSLIKPRPVRRKLTLDFGGDTELQTAVTKGLFQGRCYYKPDSGGETLIASISGRLFQFTPSGSTATVAEITGGNPQSSTALQCWLWQAENYVFWNDGINLTVFFNGTTTTRSRGGSGASPPMYIVAVPFNGIGPNTPITLTYAFVGSNGDTVTLSPGTGSDKLGVVVSGAGTTNIVVTFGLTIANYPVSAGTQLLDTAATGNASTLSQTLVIPNGYDTTTSLTVNLTSAYTGSANIVISNGTTFPIAGVVTAGIPGNTLQIKFTGLSNTGTSSLYFGPNITLAKGQILLDTAQSPQAAAQPPQFPAGRMGAYGRGRVWMVLTDGKRFVAGDIVGGSSGTKALDFRDAVLNITENDYLVGGGFFTVPGSVGDIRAMVFTAQLDVSLGQGPLMVFTPTHVFSCNAPVDRLTWQSLTNPILTESAIGNGGLGQDSTFVVNSDTIYRAVDGIRSLILSTQDFNTWVRTPISHEVEKLLNQDNQSLLPWSSGVFFDNRILMTASPISTPQGVYHKALVSINNDLISTLRDKKPPSYDGVWPGQNSLSVVTGEFSLVERCYQFTFNTVQSVIELWELLPSSVSDVQNNPNPVVADNNGQDAIEWWFDSSSLFKEVIAKRTFKRLFNGEIMVDKLVGRVDFQVFWKPDQYPCWTPWFSWSECATQNTGSPTDTTKPQFRPRMGFGEPPNQPCDTSTNRPLREGYTFQIRVVITGQCEVVGLRLAAVTLPEPVFAPMSCTPIC